MGKSVPEEENKPTLPPTDYKVDDLSETGKKLLLQVRFATERINEMDNQKALLRQAKNGYVYNLRQEILKEKSGFLFGDN
jgi:hypothetical protein